MKTTHRQALVSVLAIISTAGCATASRPAPVAASLYDRLGGRDAITAVVDDMLARIGRDPRINARFANADMPHLRQMLIEQICAATGGPCRYTGKDMRTAHAGMAIASRDFDALVEDLKNALDHFKVPSREQNDLLGALAAMRPDVVAVPGRLSAAGKDATDPVLGRALSFRAAAGLLEQADAARLAANRSYADQLFSSAEILTGAGSLADLAPLFRRGAPPRIETPLATVPRDTPPQPATVGSSDEEEPDAPPKRGSLVGTVVAQGGRLPDELAVVTLEPTSGKFRRRTPKMRVIEQRGRQFAPRMLTIPVGSTVSFPNFDDIFHNVFSTSEARPFDLGIYKSGQSRDLVFDKEGVVRIGCNLHANMAATVVVVSAPHYVITDAQGHFAFRSLEPGRYKMRTWTEASDQPETEEIEIKAGRNSVTVTPPTGRSFARLVDKFGAPRGTATAHP